MTLYIYIYISFEKCITMHLNQSPIHVNLDLLKNKKWICLLQQPGMSSTFFPASRDYSSETGASSVRWLSDPSWNPGCSLHHLTVFMPHTLPWIWRRYKFCFLNKYEIIILLLTAKAGVLPHSEYNPHFLAWLTTKEGHGLPCLCPHLEPSLHLL